MQTGKSSRTAAYVAFLRALGDRGETTAQGFHDEAVCALLPSRWARALAWFGPKISLLPFAVRRRVVAHVDLLVFRALAIDAELTVALAAGCRQVVILGAGSDSRAHRLTALEAAHVFEVDHPATQSEKQHLAADLARTCRELTYVTCDFERDSLAERLQSVGHRADEPTIWSSSAPGSRSRRTSACANRAAPASPSPAFLNGPVVADPPQALTHATI